MRERVVSVNVGAVAPLRTGDRSVRTGIVKRPVDGPVMVRPGGLAGDGQGNRTVHGGPHMAVYLYSHDANTWWADRLGRDIPPGTFGENLTVTGMPDAAVAAGDRFTVGAVLLEVTIPRLPCATLAAWMGDPEFATTFANAGLLGFYARVLREGPVRAGDTVERVARGPAPEVTIAELARVRLHGARDVAGLRGIAAANAVLHPRWREWIAARLADA